MNEGQAEYARGLADEDLVKGFLRTKYEVEESTADENIKLDIDAYVKGVPVSIKCMNARTPKNFAFELQVQNARGEWNDSWFHNGKAKKYIIWHRGMDTIFGLDKSKVLNYIKTHDFDRKTGLSANTKEIQSFHRDKDVIIGLISIAKLVEAGVAVVLSDTFTGTY